MFFSQAGVPACLIKQDLDGTLERNRRFSPALLFGAAAGEEEPGSSALALLGARQSLCFPPGCLCQEPQGELQERVAKKEPPPRCRELGAAAVLFPVSLRPSPASRAVPQVPEPCSGAGGAAEGEVGAAEGCGALLCQQERFSFPSPCGELGGVFLRVRFLGSWSCGRLHARTALGDALCQRGC